MSLRRQIDKEYPDWRIQTADDLGARAKEVWAKRSTCPGIATGRFLDASAAYAVLLVRRQGPTSVKLMMFLKSDSSTSFDSRTVDDESTPKPQNFFIRSDTIRESTKQRFGAIARDGILFFDAGDDEYGTYLYYWTKTGVRNNWVDQ